MNIITYKDKTIDIYTYNNKYEYNLTLVNFLNVLCLKNGSSLKGRIEAFNYIVNSYQKTPIIVSFDSSIILIPLYSIYNDDCILINYFNIKKFKYKENTTIIYFNDGSIRNLDIDVRILRKQVKRVDQYLNLLKLNKYSDFTTNFA